MQHKRWVSSHVRRSNPRMVPLLLLMPQSMMTLFWGKSDKWLTSGSSALHLWCCHGCSSLALAALERQSTTVRLKVERTSERTGCFGIGRLRVCAIPFFPHKPGPFGISPKLGGEVYLFVFIHPPGTAQLLLQDQHGPRHRSGVNDGNDGNDGNGQNISSFFSA